jgi:hypothetical protein
MKTEKWLKERDALRFYVFIPAVHIFRVLGFYESHVIHEIPGLGLHSVLRAMHKTVPCEV